MDVFDESGLRVTLPAGDWFRFADIRPYGKVQNLFDQVAALLESKGWKMAPAIDGLLDTGSDIGHLVDTTFIASDNYRDEEEFPPEPGVQGYNAAASFTIVVEKLGTEPKFSENEIEQIRQLALVAAKLVYTEALAEVVEV